MSVLITGASGLIGKALTSRLMALDYRVVHLARTARTGSIPCYAWDITSGKLDARALFKTETIIHLAGAGVAERRWTARRKKEILESRIQSTNLLYETLRDQPHQVKTFVAASAIGYYGTECGDNKVTEEYPAGKDFLADVVEQWEKSVDQIATLGIRVVKIRIGIVLSAEGGALKEIIKPIQWMAGAPLGDGKQIMSWIHIKDLCRMFVQAVEDPSWSGTYNGVSLHPCTNAELTRMAARLLHRPLLLPSVPAWVLRLILGEMADIVVKGCYVVPQRALKQGFNFNFPNLEEALTDLLVKE